MDLNRCSFFPTGIITLASHDQPIHVDFTDLWEDTADIPWVLHGPLCEEGSWLNIMATEKLKESTRVLPLHAHIPFTTFLLTRGDVPHSGIFGSKGNVRFHMVLGPSHNICSDSLSFLSAGHFRHLPAAAEYRKTQIEVAEIDPQILHDLPEDAKKLVQNIKHF